MTRNGAPEPPGGFARRDVPPRFLYARHDWIDDVVGAGLMGPAGWRGLLEPFPGRGGARRLEITGRPRLLLKPMRRGGLVEPVLHDRFFGTSRLVRNLTLPEEAGSRGIPTPRAVALLLERAGLGFWRGWLAVEALEGAEDLATRWSSVAPDEAEVEAVLVMTRRAHDAGLVHRDLNLGNVMVRRSGITWEAFVVDLDGARLAPGPLPAELRLSALRRLERSYRKIFGTPGPARGLGPESWIGLYASGDDDLRRRLEAGRRTT